MEKIAILADIHGNLAALHALIADLDRWSPDLVVVAGDTVNRGPQSGPCLDLVLTLARERGWRLIRGNHERYLISYDRDRHRPDFPRSGLHYEFSRIIEWTRIQIADHIATIAAMPEHLRISLGVEELVVYHASVRHDRDGLEPGSPDEELRRQIDPAAAVFCAGHTHMPFTRRLDGTLVVNVGSVGLPFDGDRRAAYARLTRGRGGWEARIVRLAYDFDATERIFLEGGMFDAIGAYGPLVLREIQTGRSLLFGFFPAYHERIQAGEISIVEAVREFLTTFDQAA